jgi:hypothetical protein
MLSREGKERRGKAQEFYFAHKKIDQVDFRKLSKINRR